MTNKRKRYLFLSKKTILFLLSLFFTLPVFALRIDNPKIKVKLSPYETYTGTIIVDNPSTEDVFVRVYLEDFAYLSPFDGSKEFYPPQATKFSLYKWLNFSPKEFTLSPYSRKNVNFTIKPDDNFNYVHCGIIFFETSIGTTYDETGKAIKIVGRLGSLIFVEPKEAKKEGRFENIQESQYKIKGNFSNLGDTFLYITGTFYIMNEEGIVKDRGKTKELYLLPEDKTEVDIDFSKELSPSYRRRLAENNYTMILTFDMEDGDVLIKEIDFSLKSSGEVNILGTRD